MLAHQDERGRVAYTCSAGVTTFWRRQPAQLAGTLAFMLSGDATDFGRIRGSGRVRAAEVEPLRECLLWLRHNNPHMQTCVPNAEQFVSL